MIILTPLLFWISISLGFLCLAGAYFIEKWYLKNNSPTPKQELLHKYLSPFLFLCFLVFGFTPIFFWFLFLPF